MYPKKVHHIYYRVRNSNQYDDNKMFSGNSVLSANNQTPCKTNVLFYITDERYLYTEVNIKTILQKLGTPALRQKAKAK